MDELINKSNKNLKITSNETIPWVEKYRPKILEDVISHNIITETLRNFIEKNRLPHLIFYGPPGTGKTSTIIACARELYKKYYDVMVMEINASKERGIEIVRKRITQFINSKNLIFSSNVDANTDYKLVILDEVDAMTIDAQASLRRIIEKYTKNVRFCFICNYIKKIDTAIQSRCICFKFSPLKDMYIKQKLDYIIIQENIKYEKEGINRIIKKSNGDMRKVINILQTTVMSNKIVTEENVNKCLDAPSRNEIEDILEILIKDSFKECYDNLKTYIQEQGHSLTDIINEIYDVIIEDFLSNQSKKNINLSEKKILNILKSLGNIQYNLCNIMDENMQLGYLISIFKLE